LGTIILAKIPIIATTTSHNAKFFDLYTLGADGVPGGNDKNEDIGNWD
jgi:hypothetical protein